MQRKTYIFGHKNPDTDSICSAIAYAYLKQQLGMNNVEAVRIGELNKETLYVLEYFTVKEPRLVEEIKSKVKDLDLSPVTSITANTPVIKAVDITLNVNSKHTTPIVDKKERLIGVVTLSDLIPNITGNIDSIYLKENNTPFENIIELLNAIVVKGEYPYKNVKGKIYTILDLNNAKIKKGDFLILDNNEENRQLAYNSGASCLIIITKDEIIDDIPEAFKGIVVRVNLPVYSIIKIISEAIPIDKIIKKSMLEYFELNDILDDVKEQVLSSKHRVFPVIDENGVVKGILSRSDFFNIHRKQVILIDHNEYGQSIKGIEDAEILEVIDHHRIANIQTMAPLYYRAEPVGCTSTIIFTLFNENNVKIPKKIAGLMLSAILSDTLVFKSPTCTQRDIEAARNLAKIAEVEIEEYGMNMIFAGTAIDNETPVELITRDMKRFTIGKYRTIISQINTGDVKKISNMLPAIEERLEQYCEENNLDMALMMVTNIILGGSEIIVAGKEKWIVQNAFNIPYNETTIYLPGVFSRKKQIVPVLMNAAQMG